jgi:uncharacterized membrane protein YkgB
VVLRVISVLWGLVLLLASGREIREMSSLQRVIWCGAIIGFIVIAGIRFRKVSKSFSLTVMLAGITAVPFCLTVVQVFVSFLRSDLGRTDMVTWVLLLLLLVLELVLPLALVIEYRTEKRARGQN